MEITYINLAIDLIQSMNGVFMVDAGGIKSSIKPTNYNEKKDPIYCTGAIEPPVNRKTIHKMLEQIQDATKEISSNYVASIQNVHNEINGLLMGFFIDSGMSPEQWNPKELSELAYSVKATGPVNDTTLSLYKFWMLYKNGVQVGYTVYVDWGRFEHDQTSGMFSNPPLYNLFGHPRVIPLIPFQIERPV